MKVNKNFENKKNILKKNRNGSFTNDEPISIKKYVSYILETICVFFKN